MAPKELKIDCKGSVKILIYTDSRGQHKPAGQTHQMFGERMQADPRLQVDLFLCPMKWTTTLDFLDAFSPERLASYDAVILYTGIVDWSPRRYSSALNDLYDNKNIVNLDNQALNTRDYSRKVVNNKKNIFDEVFGEAVLEQHFRQPMVDEYEGEPTINMYSLEMAKTSLLPRLLSIDNLIYISANRFIAGWDGDYKKKRPINISISHAYSDLFSQTFPATRLIDLREWSDKQVMELTCDNLHLTKRGSDYIYEKIMERLQLSPMEKTFTPELAKEFQGIRPLERITPSKKPGILNAAKRVGFLATLVIGLRLPEGDATRLANLRVLLDWIDYYYGDLFDVLLVEQDSISRLKLSELTNKTYVRHEFIYNPKDFNRGWGYNVAVKDFCSASEVVALMDTDVLTGGNFVREVIDCHSKYDAISPYQNIYYSDYNECELVKAARRIDGLKDGSKIKNPVTLSGGILIIRRDIFIGVQGFEQYVGYGCEDRALDVTLFNHVDPGRLRIAPETYVHLFHEPDVGARARFKEIYDHLIENYGCKYTPSLGAYAFIHQGCNHAPRSKTLRLMRERAESFGDKNLYRSKTEPRVNGIVPRRVSACTRTADIIYPTEFDTLESYEKRERYDEAPSPDSDEIAAFYNAYKGKRCFIIGNGPSLNKHDLSLLENEYTFGVNSFYYKTRESGFRPFFYVVEDSSVMKENIEEIRKFDAPFKFFPTNYRRLHPKRPNTFFFKMNRGFYEKSSPNFVVPRFSTDASKVLYCGQSVTYINLQLAYFMGFSEVYLIGMDFSYIIPDSHKRTGDVLLSDSDDPNHFHKDYFGKGKTWKDPKLDRVGLNYRMAKLVYEATGRRIFNATAGGSLEVFDRVDYESLFNGKIGEEVDSHQRFSSANKLYREKSYAKALEAYVALAKDNPTLFMYKRCAVDAFLRATEAQQSCGAAEAAFVRGLMFNL
jgi:Protein of unknown function DUF115